jgi:hypothetical protein
MSRKCLLAVVLCLIMFAQLGCGTGQQLVSIQVTPPAVIFGGACPVGATDCGTVQLTAMGTYIHPPATKNITSEVTWTSDIPVVVVVSSGGLLTAGPDCGVANVTATDSIRAAHDSVITATATVTVDGPSTSNCPTTPI